MARFTIPRDLYHGKDAIDALNALLAKILPLRPLREVGFVEQDIVDFPKSVEANQQRLLSNAYVPMDLELMERVYRECF